VELRAWLAFVAAGEFWGGGELLAAILAGARRKARVVVLGWWYWGGQGGVSEDIEESPQSGAGSVALAGWLARIAAWLHLGHCARLD
jgi:hypothetical protein